VLMHMFNGCTHQHDQGSMRGWWGPTPARSVFIVEGIVGLQVRFVP
jgi:hypothetical protein